MKFPNFVECRNHLGPWYKYNSGPTLPHRAQDSVFISFLGDSDTKKSENEPFLWFEYLENSQDVREIRMSYILVLLKLSCAFKSPRNLAKIHILIH